MLATETTRIGERRRYLKNADGIDLSFKNEKSYCAYEYQSENSLVKNLSMLT